MVSGPNVRRWLVAKASSLKPRPSLLYLEAQMSGRNVSWVDKEAMHSLRRLNLTRNLELAGAWSGQAHQYAVWKG